MKKTKALAICFSIFCLTVVLTACGKSPEITITLGKYNPTQQTFTSVTTGDNYYLTISGTTLTLNGTIPYSSSMLGLDAGNIVAIKFMPTTNLEADTTTLIKTSNYQSNVMSWNTYDKNALESDGSIIWVTSVNKSNNSQIKIKWNSQFDEITYTLNVNSNATLQTA